MAKKYYKFPTKRIKNKEVKTMFDAVYVAYRNKIMLNRFITINTESMSNSNNKQLLIKFLDHYRKFARKQGFEHAYLWVLEDNQHVGLHAHILLHFPANSHINLFKSRCVKSWFKEYQPSYFGVGRAFDFKSLNYGFYDNPQYLAMRLNELERQIIKKQSRIHLEHTKNQFDDILCTLDYLCKGINKNSQGQIDGYRINMSSNLKNNQD